MPYLKPNKDFELPGLPGEMFAMECVVWVILQY